MSRVRVLVATSREPVAADSLSTADRDRLDGLRPAQRHEWLLARNAARILRGLTGAHDVVRPHFSLSHSPRIGAAATITAAGPAAAPLPAAALAPVGVGIDIEEPRVVDHRTARFFLDGAERRAAADPRDHIRLWTVKEALFKAHPDNADGMLHDYTVSSPRAVRGTARCHRDPSVRFGYHSATVAGAQLSVAAAFTDGASPMRRWKTMPEVTFEVVAERVKALLNVTNTELTPETPLRGLAADSFQLVEVVIDLQEELDTIVTQDQLREVQTLGDLVSVLQAAGAGPEGNHVAAS